LAVRVQDLVAGDLENPGFEARSRLELLEAPEGRAQHVLQGVLEVLATPEQVAAEGEEFFADAGELRFERSSQILAIHHGAACRPRPAAPQALRFVGWMSRSVRNHTSRGPPALGPGSV